MSDPKTGKVRPEGKRKLENQLLRQVGVMIVSFARRFAPVDTGRLRSSIQFVVEDGVLYVGTNVNYAKHQEFGTRFMQANPFMRPAFDATRNKLEG